MGDLLKLLVYVVVFCLPVALVVFILNRRRRAYQAEARAPFTDLPLRPAGESLRRKLEELDDRFMEHGSCLMLMPALCVAIGFSGRWFDRPWVGGSLALGSLLFVSIQARQILRLQRKRWTYRLGYEGERYVGETLNQLLALGYRVFHDVPFSNYNIDHVIVGADGVYAIETKTRRKRTHAPANEKARVEVEGDRIQASHFTDTSSIPQAVRNARSLADWLTRSTGELTTVEPLVVLVGWYVVRKPGAQVRVLNEKELKHAFPMRNATPLSPERLQRIVHQLTERCRLPQDNGTRFDVAAPVDRIPKHAAVGS
ncbi:MAG: NERD domain-containing protein [Opitutaceae bacterium]|nr:NERD domain-containing protein [Opitutaceae bacterium]